MRRSHNKPKPFDTYTEALSNGDRIIARHYESPDPVSAVLADKTQVILPYANTSIVTSTRPRFSRKETVLAEERATGVAYKRLSKLARHCIALAQNAAATNRWRTDTLPDYKRLALCDTTDGQPPALYSVLARDGMARSIFSYPDQNVTTIMQPKDELTRELDYPIETLQPAGASFLVVPHRGDHLERTTYRDAEPNVFGPGAAQANAFWISGRPRAVHGGEDPQLMRRDSMLQLQPRFAIMPVAFYMAQEDRSGSA